MSVYTDGSMGMNRWMVGRTDGWLDRRMGETNASTVPAFTFLLEMGTPGPLG